MFSARSCSGDMYATLPLICPACVLRPWFTAFAMPKSSTRAVPSRPTRMLSGEMSRWMSPSELPSSLRVSWTACRPCSACDAIAPTTLSGSRAPFLVRAKMSFAKDSPST